MANPRGFITLSFDDAELLAAMGRAQTSVKPAVRAAAKKSGKQLVRDMRTRLSKAGRVDTRRLYNAVAARSTESGDIITIEVGPRIGDPSVEPYDIVVDRGRAPGRPWPPKGVMLPWMGRHGIPARAEYPIRRKIGEEGTKAAPYIDVAGERTAAVLREIDAVLTTVVRSFG